MEEGLLFIIDEKKGLAAQLLKIDRDVLLNLQPAGFSKSLGHFMWRWPKEIRYDRKNHRLASLT